jgi:hypothetical protein
MIKLSFQQKIDWLMLLQGLVVPVATGDRLLNSYGDAKYNAWLGFFGSPIKKIKKE